MGMVELNFLQAVKIYKAAASEKPVPIHERHHAQILLAFDFFISTKNQEAIQVPTTKQQMSAEENRASSNLNALAKNAPTKQKKEALHRAIKMVKQGRFASKGLPKNINTFYKANEKLLISDRDKYYDRLFKEVLDQYDLSSNLDKELRHPEESPRGIIDPKIVLTQSFS